MCLCLSHHDRHRRHSISRQAQAAQHLTTTGTGGTTSQHDRRNNISPRQHLTMTGTGGTASHDDRHRRHDSSPRLAQVALQHTTTGTGGTTAHHDRHRRNRCPWLLQELCVVAIAEDETQLRKAEEAPRGGELALQVAAAGIC